MFKIKAVNSTCMNLFDAASVSEIPSNVANGINLSLIIAFW